MHNYAGLPATAKVYFTVSRVSRLMLHLAAKIAAGGEMVDRRSVLKIGAATVAGALVKMPASARNQSPTRAHLAFHRAVFDEGFAECREFAAELRHAGVFPSAIRGDVAALWYDDLRANLRETRLPVVGLTDRAALFCLEELARDVGMRVFFRADHIVEPNGHAPELGRATARLFSQLDVNELNASRPGDTSAQKRTGPFSPENKTALVSWIIA
jgi:TAT (twin-arginine translocation) pathway signal sequence